MQQLLNTAQGDYWAVPLLVAGGVFSALSPQMREQLLAYFPELNASNIQGAALMLGLLSGFLQAALWPVLLYWGAKLLGGKVTATQSAPKPVRPARLAAAWSSLPVLLGYLLAPLGMGDAAVVFSGVSALLSFWSLILLAHMLAAGYQLKAPRGALAVLLSGFFGLVLLFLALALATTLPIG